MNYELNPDYNFYTFKSLNRLSEKRSDEKWVKEKLFYGNAKIILVKDLKFLTTGEENIEPVFLTINDFPDDKKNNANFILLGEKEGIIYFCVDVSELKNEQLFSKLGEFRELRVLAPLLERDAAAVLAYSRAIIYWHSHNNYCGVCGHQTIVKESGHKIVCTNPKCLAEHFPRISPAVIVLVSKGEKCLLARQAGWLKGQYSTVAGFVEPGESLEQAVQREVLEETGIHTEKISYHSSQPWPFPAAIMLGFRAAAIDEEIFLGDKELEDAQWFTRDGMVEKIRNSSIRLSTKFSISYKLIQSWFDEESETKLDELVNSLQ